MPRSQRRDRGTRLFDSAMGADGPHHSDREAIVTLERRFKWKASLEFDVGGLLSPLRNREEDYEHFGARVASERAASDSITDSWLGVRSKENPFRIKSRTRNPEKRHHC